MKYVLIALATITMLLSSCQSLESSMVGSYYCDTVDGMIYLDLLEGGNCIASFQGCEEDGGYWHISDDNSIFVVVAPKKQKSSGWYVTYWIGMSSDNGEIYDNGNFSISASRAYRGNKEEKSLLFIRDSRTK